MANTTPKVFTETQKLIDKANQVKQRFADSLQKAKDDTETLEKEVAELQEKEKEIYSLFMMDMIESSAYEEAKAETTVKRNQLSNVQQKINDMDEMERYELAKIYEEYETIESAFIEERQKAYAETKQQLIDAKYQFLQQVIDISNDQFDIYSIESQMADIAVDTGKKKRNYMEYQNPYIDGIGLEMGTGNDAVNIGSRELFQVYRGRQFRPKF